MKRTTNRIDRFMKKLLLSVLFVIASTIINARPINMCFTSNSVGAELTLFFLSSPLLADLSVWVGTEVHKDVNVCFVEKPLPNSIDIQLVDNPSQADVAICLTKHTFFENTSIYITSGFTFADFYLGLWDSPQSFTKNIYIRDIDHKKLSKEAKVAIVYALGLLKKK